LGDRSNLKGKQAIVWRLFCLKRKQELGWLMRAKDVVKSAEKRDAYLFQVYFIKIGASRNKRQRCRGRNCDIRPIR